MAKIGIKALYLTAKASDILAKVARAQTAINKRRSARDTTEAVRLVLRLLEWLTCRYRSVGAIESRNIPILALSGLNRSIRPGLRPTWNSATCTAGC